MVHLAECLGSVAMLYNLALVLIAVVLYINLLRLPNPKNIFLKPWKYIFVSICIYIVEQTLAILQDKGMQILNITFPIFEFFIIILFIYALLTLREHVKVMKE